MPKIQTIPPCNSLHKSQCAALYFSLSNRSYARGTLTRAPIHSGGEPSGLALYSPTTRVQSPSNRCTGRSRFLERSENLSSRKVLIILFISDSGFRGGITKLNQVCRQNLQKWSSSWSLWALLRVVGRNIWNPCCCLWSLGCQ